MSCRLQSDMGGQQALLDMSVLCTKKAQTAETNSVSTLDWSSL